MHQQDERRIAGEYGSEQAAAAARGKRIAGGHGRSLLPKKKMKAQKRPVFSVLRVNDSVASSSSKLGKLVRIRGGEEQVIRWDRFLSRRLLTVLLVENDDCTRLVLTALLRKCSYQVSAFADGRKAWDVLKRKSQDFDLVLTEMDLPSLSGFCLLSKIMSNQICKNVPVVMMASHNSLLISSRDSLGIVLKCMLKGAADFLTKPVRNNELRNLWQHVWRKYHATLETVSDNIPAINHESSDARTGSGTSDGSDQESDSQRSSGGTEVKDGGSLKLKENLESENQEIDFESTKLQCNVSNDNNKAKGSSFCLPKGLETGLLPPRENLDVSISRTAISSKLYQDEPPIFVLSKISNCK